MKISTDFTTGSGKGIGRLHDGHFSIEMRRDKRVYENYFHFRIDSEDFEGEAVVDIYPDQDFLPESRRIIDTHFSPAIIWRSPDGPFTTDPGGWRPHPQHLMEWHRDFMRMRMWLDPKTSIYVSSHHPLAPENWIALLQTKVAERADLCRYSSIGLTPEGREIPCLTIGSAQKRVVVMAAEHPIETPGSWATWGIIDYLTSTLREARALLEEYTFECLPVVNVDGLARGNPCFSSTGIDLFLAYAGAPKGEFAAEEARSVWQHATGKPLSLLLDFHCYMGGSHNQDYPGEGLYMIPRAAQDEVFSEKAGHAYRTINDRVIFSTDARSSHWRAAALTEDNLCYQLARERDVPSVFYELNGGLNGPYRNSRNGIGVFTAAMRGLGEAFESG
jgi:hypothetical protein